MALLGGILTASLCYSGALEQGMKLHKILPGQLTMNFVLPFSAFDLPYTCNGKDWEYSIQRCILEAAGGLDFCNFHTFTFGGCGACGWWGCDVGEYGG